MALRQDGYGARHHRKKNQGQLLDQETACWHGHTGRAHGGSSESSAPEGPDIQKQEREGKGHEHRLGHQPESQQHERSRIGRPASAPRIRQPRQRRQEPKEGGEDILTLGDPSHRLDVQRVDSEQRRNEGAPPLRARCTTQQGEEQHCVCGVQPDIYQMMGNGIDTEQLDVQHVGEPRKREPIVAPERREGPADTFGTDT